MDTLGLVESKSIAAGAELTDGMLKAAPVELVRASMICSGRFLIVVTGDRGAVETSVAFARASGRPLMGSFVISGVSPLVLGALKRGAAYRKGEALGVVESRTASSGVAAADAAVKRAHVRILRLVMGQGITGKSCLVLGGDVAAVEEAVAAAKEVLGDKLVEAVVISRPDGAAVRAITGGVRNA